MKKRIAVILCSLFVLAAAVVWDALPQLKPYGYARPVSDAEARNRELLIAAAGQYLGCNQYDGSHKPIIDLYNSHEPLAQNYAVSYSDKWCAAFVSAAAISCGMTDIIPTECGCQRQIGLFQKLGCWEEQDDYIPLPGDIIYYCTSNTASGDCSARSNHVGIVVGTNGNLIKVIEGNYIGSVRYRYIRVDDVTIRGYGLPDYNSKR